LTVVEISPFGECQTMINIRRKVQRDKDEPEKMKKSVWQQIGSWEDPANGKKLLRYQTTHQLSPKIEVHKVQLRSNDWWTWQALATMTVKANDRKRSVFHVEEVACSLESSLARKRS